MILRYTPAGGDEQTYEIQRLSMAEQLDAFVLGGVDDPKAAAAAGDPRGLRALLFLAMRRVHPSLLWQDCRPADGEVSIVDAPFVGEAGPETVVLDEPGTVKPNRKRGTA